MDPQVFLVNLQVMNIHPSSSMLLGRPWIHFMGVVTSLLCQSLKYIINGVPVIIKVDETTSMLRYMAVSFIEVEDSRDGDLHVFDVVNTKWVPENSMVRKPKILETTKIVAKSFLKHNICCDVAVAQINYPSLKQIKQDSIEQGVDPMGTI